MELLTLSLMTDKGEEIFLGHVSVGMWVMFVLGLSLVYLYSWVTIDRSEGVSKYMTLRISNILFHLVASFAVFALLGEISRLLIEKWIPVLSGSGSYNFTLSALCGAFGSPVVAWVLERAKTIFNTKKK